VFVQVSEGCGEVPSLSELQAGCTIVVVGGARAESFV
jgi:hypothetical protein